MPSRTSRKLSSTWASEEESTTAENSDADTSGNCSETPVRVTRTTDSEEGDPSIVVRSTFLDVDEGSGLQQQYRKLRRTKSEDLSCFWHPRVYVPGEYSEKKAGVLLHPSAPEDDSAARALSERTETEASEKPKAEDGGTVMLRNLPNNYTREMLMSLLDRLGLAGDYDFMYLPFDFKRDANLGYAFVNLVSSEAVESLWKALDGFSDWSLPSSKVCQVKWSGPLQGFDAHVQRYRNSPVMHKSVPEKYKPVILQNGWPVPFPEPNRRVKYSANKANN